MLAAGGRPREAGKAGGTAYFFVLVILDPSMDTPAMRCPVLT